MVLEEVCLLGLCPLRFSICHLQRQRRNLHWPPSPPQNQSFWQRPASNYEMEKHPTPECKPPTEPVSGLSQKCSPFLTFCLVIDWDTEPVPTLDSFTAGSFFPTGPAQLHCSSLCFLYFIFLLFLYLDPAVVYHYYRTSHRLHLGPLILPTPPWSPSPPFFLVLLLVVVCLFKVDMCVHHH